MKPRNDWAKSLYILKETYNTGTSMANVLIHWDATFYKFQTRLREIELKNPELTIERKNMPYMSKLSGKIKHYTHYTCTSPKEAIIELFNNINKNGL